MLYPVDIQHTILVDQSGIDGDTDRLLADEVADGRPLQGVDDGFGVGIGRLLTSIKLLGHLQRDVAVLVGLAETVLVADGDKYALGCVPLPQ